MKLFKCQHCGQMLYFENVRCERCGRGLGYLPELGTLSALEPDGDVWRALAADGAARRFCANARHDACNWMVAAGSDDLFCAACRHNRTVPDLSDLDRRLRWQRLELAKRRLFYTLFRLELPVSTKAERQDGLAFDFRADPELPDAPKVMTGHDNGLITINLSEADDAEREQRRKAMGEPYRTLLGHLRHEVGHFFWDRLVRDCGKTESFRALFGDERDDYGRALRRHYANGAPADWQSRFVSSYASTHPWEDWAETWAHYLHLVDTLETASAFGLRIHPAVAEQPELHADIDFDPFQSGIDRIVRAWLPLAFAVNSLNRSMGQPDLYPFVLPPAVMRKLAYVHAVAHGWREA